MSVSLADVPGAYSYMDRVASLCKRAPVREIPSNNTTKCHYILADSRCPTWFLSSFHPAERVVTSPVFARIPTAE